MGGIHGALFGIFLYGSLLLSPFCLLGLAFCGVAVVAGKWNAQGFRTRWLRYKKLVFGFSIPIIVMFVSCLALDYYRSYPNGHQLVYMHADACNMCRGGRVVIDQHIIENSITCSGNLVSGRLGDGRTFVLNTAAGNVTYAPRPKP